MGKSGEKFDKISNLLNIELPTSRGEFLTKMCRTRGKTAEQMSHEAIIMCLVIFPHICGRLNGHIVFV